MRKIILAFALLISLACASIIPTPNDFPPPPMTVIVELPNVTAVPTVELQTRPITAEKMSDARTFLLILKTRVASGDDVGIAESVKYPITVGATAIATADEFVENYDTIFNDSIMAALTNANEEELILLPEGVRMGQGEIWFNLFCVDVACADQEFLITQINN